MVKLRQIDSELADSQSSEEARFVAVLVAAVLGCAIGGGTVLSNSNPGNGHPVHRTQTRHQYPAMCRFVTPADGAE